MKLRTFTATDMPAAMQMVREALGDDAIILSSKPSPNGTRSIHVTAAIDTDDEEELFPFKPAPAPTPKATAAVKMVASKANEEDSAATSDLRFQVQNILRFHNMPELFIAKILQTAADSDLSSVISLHRIGSARAPHHLFRLAVERLMAAYYAFDPLPLDASAARIMLVGMPGIGKTLTVAKMAAKLAGDGQPLTVITTDNKRAGGIEQLQAFTDILGLQLKTASTQEELKSILTALPNYMRVLIDTAGCNPYDARDIRELRDYTSIKGIEPVLVMPAGGDAQEAIDMGETFASLSVRRLLITQADTTRRFGSVLAVAAAHGLAFCNISTSSSIVDTLKPAEPSLLAQLLLKYQDQPQAQNDYPYRNRLQTT